MPVLPLFKNRKGYVNVATPKGELIRFVNGMFYTHNEEHQKYLKELADRKECGVYIDADQPSIDTDSMTPHDMLKAKIIREYEDDKAKAARANTPAQTNPGDYDAGNQSRSVTSTQGTATPAGAKVQPQGEATATPVPPSLAAAKAGTGASSTSGSSGTEQEKK